MMCMSESMILKPFFMISSFRPFHAIILQSICARRNPYSIHWVYVLRSTVVSARLSRRNYLPIKLNNCLDSSAESGLEVRQASCSEGSMALVVGATDYKSLLGRISLGVCVLLYSYSASD